MHFEGFPQIMLTQMPIQELFFDTPSKDIHKCSEQNGNTTNLRQL